MSDVVSMGPWDANLAALVEWHDDEAIGEAEAEIITQLATVGVYAVSNALHKKGFSMALAVNETVLEAAFQLGRAVGQMEGRGEREVNDVDEPGDA